MKKKKSRIFEEWLQMKWNKHNNMICHLLQGWPNGQRIGESEFFFFSRSFSSFNNDTSQWWDLNAIRLHNTANSYLLWLWLTVNFATKSGPPKMQGILLTGSGPGQVYL